MKTVHKRYLGGALMVLIGGVAVYQGAGYDIGTLRQMGPGFFPVALGIILSMTGASIAVVAGMTQPQGVTERRRPEWLAWGCILLSVVAFVVVGRWGGLLPATFAVVFISALADRQNGVLHALVLSLGMVVLCLVAFWWALQLQFPLFQWG